MNKSIPKGNYLFIVLFGTLGTVLLMTSLASSQEVFAANIAWDGGGDGIKWSDCKNWRADDCPNSADDITIAGAEVVLDDDLVIGAGGSLTIEFGSALLIDASI